MSRGEHEQERRLDLPQAAEGFEREVALGAAHAARNEYPAPGSDAQARTDRRLTALSRRIPDVASGMLEIPRYPHPGGGKTERLVPRRIVGGAHKRQSDRLKHGAQCAAHQLIAPEAARRDPAVGDQHRHPGAPQRSQQHRPELGLQ